ncbi:MAG: PKD domain-containing protein [Comamonadaceae bacterium]|nr:PKD domain-containing protein [Comamonadaceae bacterium]
MNKFSLYAKSFAVAGLLPLLVACGGGGDGACNASFGALLGSVANCKKDDANAAPTANAGVIQNIAVGSLVTLDGSASTDANNNKLTYLWVVASKPTGSTAVLSSTIVPKPTFTADLAGTYTFSLVVNDGQLSSTATLATVVASNANSAPVANAGVNQNVPSGAVVYLDASASTDSNNDALTYRWSMLTKPTNSTATLLFPNSANPKFTADLAGTYVFGLTVNDGKVDSVLTATTVTAYAANVTPVANAGNNQNVGMGTVVNLDGSGSTDGNNDKLTYKWAIIYKPAGSTATLSSATVFNPSFTADASGTYVASLVVNDGKIDSEVVATTINVSGANVAPVADAGANQSVITGSEVTLNGTASTDANGDELTYKWVLSVPTGSTAVLSSDTVAQPTFTADVSGTYVAGLSVNDGKVNGIVASSRIVAAPLNTLPVANAGSAQTVYAATVVTLDGSASTDADSDTLTYKWVLTTKPTGSSAALSSATVAKPTFTADTIGVYVASLVVNDGRADSVLVTVPITAVATGVTGIGGS